MMGPPRIEMESGRFVSHVQEIEAANPDRTWQEVVTAFHRYWYAIDEGTEICLSLLSLRRSRRCEGGVKLFPPGPETDKAPSVRWDPASPPASHVIYRGWRVNVAHSYTVVRASLNRGPPSAFWMSLVAGDLGDLYQVYWCLSGAAASAASGRFSRALEDVRLSIRHFPRDQRLGNLLGYSISARLNFGWATRLSEAYAQAGL
jgi:hypothetical protein